MYPKYLNDYELAVQASLHPQTPAEKQLAEAYLALHQQLRDNAEDCVYCGAPSS